MGLNLPNVYLLLIFISSLENYSFKVFPAVDILVSL